MTITSAAAEHATVVTIDRAEKRNALDIATLEQLTAALRAVPEGSTVILTGTGSTFCSGADLSRVQAIEDLEERRAAFRKEAVTLAALVDDVMTVLTAPEITSIAAVNGHAVGGGWLMTLGCDLRVAVRGAEFWFPEAGIGRAVSERAVETLVRYAGPAAASEVLLLARRHSADDLHARWLLNEVVDGDPLPAAHALAERVAELDRGALTTVKGRIRTAAGLPDWSA